MISLYDSSFIYASKNMAPDFDTKEIKMNRHLLILAIASTFLPGCSFMNNRGHQEFSVITSNNVSATKTSCDVKNARGNWTTSPDTTIVVNQDEYPIYIRCENDKQWGATQVKLDLESSELWQKSTEKPAPNVVKNLVQLALRRPLPGEFLWPVKGLSCLFFCDVFDFVNDSQYQYPRYAYVGMNNK